MKDQGPTGPRRPLGAQTKEIEMTQFHQLSTMSDELGEDTQIQMSFGSPKDAFCPYDDLHEYYHQNLSLKDSGKRYLSHRYKKPIFGVRMLDSYEERWSKFYRYSEKSVQASILERNLRFHVNYGSMHRN